MTTSYSASRDVLNFRDESARGINPFRYATAVSFDTELATYGSLWVSNSHATGTQNIVLVLASNTADDTTSVSIPVAPMWSGEIRVVARRVLSSSGANISAVALS
jgi:hypothetical protein